MLQVKGIITVTGNLIRRKSKYLVAFRNSEMSNLCSDYLFDYLLYITQREMPENLEFTGLSENRKMEARGLEPLTSRV